MTLNNENYFRNGLLKITLNNENNFRNGLSKSHENEVLHLFLASLVEKSYLTLKLIFELEYTKMLKLFNNVRSLLYNP